MFDNGMWEPLRDSREPEGYPTRARPQTGFASEAEQADSGDSEAGSTAMQRDKSLLSSSRAPEADKSVPAIAATVTPNAGTSGTSDLQSGLPLENGAVSAPAPTPAPDADYLRTKLPELVQRMRDQQATPYDIWSRVEHLENAVAYLTTLVSMVVEIQTRKPGRAA